MANENIQKLREMSVEALNEALLNSRKKQFLLRLKRKTEGQLDKPHQVAQIRKYIAQIKTILTEKAGEQDVKN